MMEAVTETETVWYAIATNRIRCLLLSIPKDGRQRVPVASNPAQTSFRDHDQL